MSVPTILDVRKQIDIDYTNHRRLRYWRRIQPIDGQLFWNYNDYHPDPQWLLRAIDVSGDQTLKWFAWKDIHAQRPPQGAPPVHPDDKLPEKSPLTAVRRY